VFGQCLKVKRFLEQILLLLNQLYFRLTRLCKALFLGGWMGGGLVERVVVSVQIGCGDDGLDKPGEHLLLNYLIITNSITA
jgi:hypothetical protein